MKIRVTFYSAALTECAVHLQPSLLGRLFGAVETDDIATAVAPGEWMWSNGRRVENLRVWQAIERAWLDEKHRQVHERTVAAFAAIEAVRARRATHEN